ncbi:hypothetical protein P7C70_g2755, partial [Phenoliferia sp. Uapishka_3]
MADGPQRSYGILDGIGGSGRWVEQKIEDSSNSAGIPTSIYTRPLGVLEAKFDHAASQDGMSDICLQFDVEISELEGRKAFFARIVLAWATLRCRHPLLASTMQTSEGDVCSLPGSRILRYVPPPTQDAAIEDARRTVLLGDVKTMKDVLAERALNGPRRLLEQESCLARLLVFRDVDDSSSPRLGLLLVIAHAISDGLAVIAIVSELCTLLASPSLPTPSTPPPFISILEFLANPSGNLIVWHDTTHAAMSWEILPLRGDLSTSLPPSSESIYLPHLSGVNTAPPLSAGDIVLPESITKATLARQRWFWCISRALLIVRNRRTPRTLPFPRIAREGPPVQPNTEWVPMRFSNDHTTSLLGFCKHHKISPSMLSYSILSIAVSNILKRLYPDAPYQPILIGFPMSLRRFLLSQPALSDIAIRITFGCVHLPRSPQATTEENYTSLRWAALTGARLASRQLQRMFDPSPKERKHFLASSYYMIMDRLLSSHGVNANPLEAAAGVINASMVGDLDRTLPASHILPTSPPSSLRLSNIILGTRLHRGEGMLMEAFTWDGRLTFCLGFDDFCVEPKLVDEILSQVQQVGEALADAWES